MTSAESILIAAQSTTEFYQHLNKDKIVVVSISPQSRASVAAYFGISALQVSPLFYLSLSSLYFPAHSLAGAQEADNDVQRAGGGPRV